MVISTKKHEQTLRETCQESSARGIAGADEEGGRTGSDAGLSKIDDPAAGFGARALPGRDGGVRFLAGRPRSFALDHPDGECEGMPAPGIPAPRRHRASSFEFEVPFHDVDAMSVVWHGHYYKYLELARTRLLRSHGLDAASLIDSHFRFVVIESACRHTSPLCYGDRVRVSAWFREVTHRIFVDYEVTNLTRGTRAAKAHTILATTDREGRLLLRTPAAILGRLTSPNALGACSDDAGRPPSK